MKQDEGLAKPKGGSMVFIASISARMASKAQYTSDYCASKGAVVALATQLGCELLQIEESVSIPFLLGRFCHLDK